MIVTKTMVSTNPPTAPGAAWDEQLLADPHAVADKRSRVQKMFAAIAPSYDINNRLHSFWRDQAWRRKAVKIAELKQTDRVVDVACGTGDLTIAFARSLITYDKGWKNESLVSNQVLGIDFTYEMLPLAKRKGDFQLLNGWRDELGDVAETVGWLNGDAQSLPLPDACADVVSIAFGIRNVQNIPTALKEFRRILKPGGRLVILEFSKPTNPLLRVMNDFYCGKVMPITATLISRDKSGAYKYLPKSVDTFIGREQMVQMMTDAGFANVQQFPMTFGVCVCYRGLIVT